MTRTATARSPRALTPARHYGRAGTLAMYTLVGLGLWCLFFRDILLSGGDTVPGDRGDPRLIIVLLEHWYRALQGLDPWRSPNFYFPVQGVLGYSEGFFFFALLYIPARLLQFDPFTSYQITLCVLLALGYTGMAFLLHRGFRVHPLPGSLSAGIFVFSWMNFAADAQSQMYAIALLPYIGIATMYAFKHRDHCPQIQLRPTLAVVIVFAISAMTSFYCTWFFGFLLLTAGLVSIGVYSWDIGASRVVQAVLLFIRTNGARLLLTLVTAILALVPFALTYIPVLPKTAVTNWQFVQRLLPVPVTGGIRTPLLLAFVWGMFVCIRSAFFDKLRKSSVPKLEASISVMLGIATVLIWIVMYQNSGRTLWYWIFRFFPGAYAIRAVNRINQLLLGPVVIVSSVGLSSILKARLKGASAFFATIIVIAVCVWQVRDQYESKHMSFSKSADLSFLAAIPPPPRTCQGFAYVWDSDKKTLLQDLQTDAMLIAQRYNIPTVNGYSGRAPVNWWLMDATGGQGYLAQVRHWASLSNINSGLCTYEVEAKRWHALDKSSENTALADGAWFETKYNPDGSMPVKVFYRDPQGADDIALAFFLLNDGLDPVRACFVQYDRSSGVLSLMNDAGLPDGRLTVAPGEHRRIQNSQCEVYGGSTRVERNGPRLTLDLGLGFANTFLGKRSAYGLATTRAKPGLGYWDYVGTEKLAKSKQ